MNKFIQFFVNIKQASLAIAWALVGVIAVLCLVSLIVPSAKIGVLRAVISTLKSIIAAGSQVGLSGLVVLAICLLAIKK